jgi:hypothetical protein
MIQWEAKKGEKQKQRQPLNRSNAELQFSLSFLFWREHFVVFCFVSVCFDLCLLWLCCTTRNKEIKK